MKLAIAASAISLLFAWVGAADAATVTYAYDALGRLVSATYSTGYTVVYTYDANGNRTAKVVTHP